MNIVPWVHYDTWSRGSLAAIHYVAIAIQFFMKGETDEKHFPLYGVLSNN